MVPPMAALPAYWLSEKKISKSAATWKARARYSGPVTFRQPRDEASGFFGRSLLATAAGCHGSDRQGARVRGRRVRQWRLGARAGGAPALPGAVCRKGSSA